MGEETEKSSLYCVSMTQQTTDDQMVWVVYNEIVYKEKETHDTDLKAFLVYF